MIRSATPMAATFSAARSEGDIAPVACLECNAKACERTRECRTLPMWSELNGRIQDYVDHVTIADLMRKE